MKTICTRNPQRLATALACTTALAGLFLDLTPAFAQEAEGGIETITVTARARAEDIHNVPSQVTAFTAEQIQAMGIHKPQDFIQAVPNVSFVETQNAGTSFLVIRGISQARNSEPSAAIVVDGVPMTQPAQFNQELLDIQQIEVVKGPQGALYGRDAIGGAIIITTKQPGDTWEGQVTAGYENGPGGRVNGVVGGPVGDTLGIRLAASYFDTRGHLENHDTVDPSADRFADPVKDFNARFTAVWKPSANFTADLRLSTDLLTTRALYYIIPPFGSPHFNDPNFTSQPINLNNSGENARKIYDAALKLSYAVGSGTLSSITGYNSTWEILTGDGYTFDPFGHSQIFFDFNQSQFLKVKTFTQEVRYTSDSSARFRYIVGAEIYSTDRFIATGNMCDTDNSGVPAEYYHPQAHYCFESFPFPAHGQITFLSDSQKQFAWAGYVDTSYSITDALELSLNIRYDSDHRKNTTDTPQFYLTVGGIPGTTGQQREHTWDDWQPQAILRYSVDDHLNVYASYSRGFRSGGFNQTGVAQAAQAANFPNVGDLFNQETADTYEAGFKSRWFDDRLVLNGSVYTTRDQGDYYFVFLASNSTQNLGNIDKTNFTGFDLDLTARLSEDFTVNAGFGYTDSEVKEFPTVCLVGSPPCGPGNTLKVVGSRAPLVPLYTLNIGAQWAREIAPDWNAVVRVDYNRIGETTFVIPVQSEPRPMERDPVDLVNVRAGFEHNSWQLMFWSRNLFDKKYNTEYSTGGFLFKAEPQTWGIDLTKTF